MSSHDACCNHRKSTPSVYQSLDEIDFERGIWNFAMNGDIVKLREKLDSGVDPSVCDASGYTALHYAARNGRTEACAILLQRGANANAQTRGGATPLHRAAFQGHLDIIKLLIKYKADPCVCDSDGKTALHKAAEENHFDAAEFLVNIKPELVSMKDNRDHIPLFYIDSQNIDLVNLLT